MSTVEMTCLDCGVKTSAETTAETSAWSAAHECSNQPNRTQEEQ